MSGLDQQLLAELAQMALAQRSTVDFTTLRHDYLAILLRAPVGRVEVGSSTIRDELMQIARTAINAIAAHDAKQGAPRRAAEEIADQADVAAAAAPHHARQEAHRPVPPNLWKPYKDD